VADRNERQATKSLDRIESISYSRGVAEPSLTGRLIRYHRVKRGWTPAELAELIGVSRPAVVQWESGDTSPSDEHTTAAVAAFGLTHAGFYAAERHLAAFEQKREAVG
jgi:transcriptional regulator with XRE-family HTH domain